MQSLISAFCARACPELVEGMGALPHGLCDFGEIGREMRGQTGRSPVFRASAETRSVLCQHRKPEYVPSVPSFPYCWFFFMYLCTFLAIFAFLNIIRWTPRMSSEKSMT